MNTDEITQKIKNTKKYKHLEPSLIEQVVSSVAGRYQSSYEVDRKARNILHQLWGAYYNDAPNFKKMAKQYQQNIQQKIPIKQALLPILATHASTRERVGLLAEFYAKIFATTGTPESIVDHACGLNPLTIPWMNLPKETSYSAFDIDAHGTEFIIDIIELTKEIQSGAFPESTFISQQSIQSSVNHSSEVAFFFKCITCLDHLEKGIGLKALEQQVCKYAVVTFPIKSIKGYEKGMKDFYANHFEQYLAGKPWGIEKLTFQTELVYVLKK